MKIQIRVKRWTVRVTKPGSAIQTDYSVYSVDEWHARLIAFAMDWGFNGVKITAYQVNTALRQTKILSST